MNRQDTLGNTHTQASTATLAHYEQALHELRCYVGNPVATLDTALQDEPGFVMGHVLRGYLQLVGAEPAGAALARADLARAQVLPVNAHEAAHLHALDHMAHGRWKQAARLLEDIAIEHPRDSVALQIGHLVDFLVGDSRMLRDRIARALPSWSAQMPGYHALLGMHAFGLEECGQYTRAEDTGRRAIELEPRDAWAQHAVAHVFEMTGRRSQGIAWMRTRQPNWAENNFFAIHNWWHLALYHLGLDQIDEALAIYDAHIAGPQSPLALDLTDASAMLWRLHLRGIDVRARWRAVAEGWAPLADAGWYAFNDAHAAMAFVGADQPRRLQQVLDAQQRVLREGHGDNLQFTREVGAPVTQAIAAFGQGDFGRCVELLRPVRHLAHRFGGSHAQRDLIDLTLIEAARRSGQAALLRALQAERAPAHGEG